MSLRTLIQRNQIQVKFNLNLKSIFFRMLFTQPQVVPLWRQHPSEATPLVVKFLLVEELIAGAQRNANSWNRYNVCVLRDAVASNMLVQNTHFLSLECTPECSSIQISRMIRSDMAIIDRDATGALHQVPGITYARSKQ